MTRKYLPLLCCTALISSPLLFNACDPHPPENAVDSGDNDSSNDSDPSSSPAPSSSSKDSDDDDDDKPSSESDDDSQSEDDESTDGEDSQSEDDESTDGEDTGEDTGVETFDIEAGMKIVDQSGKVIGGFGVQFCGPVIDGIPLRCLIGKSDDEGEVKFDANLQPGWWSAKFVPSNSFPDNIYTGNAVRLDLEEGKETHTGAVMIPEVKSLEKFDVEETKYIDVELTETLTLNLIPEKLEFLSADNTDLGAVQVDEKHWPEPTLEEEKVVGMWGFALFGNGSKEAIGIEIKDSLGLDAETKLNFYELNKDLGEFERVAEGQVSADGKMITTNEGQGLGHLTWMAITVAED